MGPAPLPDRTGQIRGNRLHQPWMGVRGHQPDPVQAAGNQISEECIPRGLGLASCDLDPEHFPASVGVDPGGDQRHRVDDPATFTNFHHQHVRGD